MPGASMRHATTMPTNNINAYMMRVVVEFFDVGHAAQHNEHAALPQQQATCEAHIAGNAIREPIVNFSSFSSNKITS